MAVSYRFKFPFDKRRFEASKAVKREYGNLSFEVYKQQIVNAVLRDIKAVWPVRTGRSKRAMRVRIADGFLIVSNRWDYVIYVEGEPGNRNIIHRVAQFHLKRVRRLAGV